MSIVKKSILLFLLKNAPFILLAVVFAGFAALSPELFTRFFTKENLINILVQTASIGIVATGMTFVLLTAGIDLSVGAIMFLSAAVAGKLILAGQPIALAFATIIGIGILYGAFNAFLVTRLRILPFIVTLSTQFVGRGLGLLITETRAMNIPALVQIGTAKILRIPSPIWIFAAVLLIAHVTLTRMPFGRHIYAIGNDVEVAKKAGINTRRVLFVVYVVSGLCAAIGGLVFLSQLGAVSPKLGHQREFAAIAAAVLGGTSLFGGRGKVFPGTLLGAVLIQTVFNVLVILRANPYVYPLMTSSIIFLAVFMDSVRQTQLQQLKRRTIRADTPR